jgi:radical SAM superfamily enzyme YgiQ (UPF0313 family)
MEESPMPKNILLVSPDFDVETFWINEEEGACAEVVNNVAPLGLATVAGMTPPDYRVDIWDEVVHGRIDATTEFARDYDLVGVTGYNGHFVRARALASVFRDRGIPVVAGGPGVSGMPDRYRPYFDVLFIGEAERTWPRFLNDWSRGELQSEYRQIETIDLSDSPIPVWDSVVDDMNRYAMGAVQTTRGCPFDCEFCDVIYLFGRKSRHKPIENVLQEVAALEALGMKHVLFCDDEFIGDFRYTKDLLKRLIPLNNSFARPLYFSTQLTMNLSRDDELLELMADANFDPVFIGIETPNKEALKETGKFQNVRADLVADVKRILSYGISIRAGMIVGFDHDDRDIFDIQFSFLQETGIPIAVASMLKAIPGTRLWRRLREEGRVLDITQVVGDSKQGDAFKPRSYTNVVPKLMSRAELMDGFSGLIERVYDWNNFEYRMKRFVSGVTRRPDVNEPPLTTGEKNALAKIGEMDPESKEPVRRILEHTENTAPFMMRRVKTLIHYEFRHVATYKTACRYLKRLVELESSGKLRFAPDARPVPIPQAFRRVYDRLFPEVHRRVYLNLEDRRFVPEALTEVFVDFLTRWGGSFDAFGEHHREFLKELCDRTCAKFNGTPPQDFVPRDEAGEETVPSALRLRLGEDVIKSVEHELIKQGSAGVAIHVQ